MGNTKSFFSFSVVFGFSVFLQLQVEIPLRQETEDSDTIYAIITLLLGTYDSKNFKTDC